MFWTILLYGLIPLIAFAVLDSLAGIKSGFIAAVAFAVAEIFVLHRTTGGWDPVSFVAAALIVALGVISVRLNSSTYFKFQPVFVSLVLAAVVAYMQFGGTPLVYHYLPLIEQASPPTLKPHLQDKAFLAILNQLLNWVIALILIHGALVAYAALRCSTLTWLVIRGIGFWVLAVVMVILQMVYLFFFAAK